MTSVEWLFEELFNSFEKFNNGEISFNEYLSHNLIIREQAKEMHKQEIKDAYIKGREEHYLDYYPQKHSEEYYQETFTSLVVSRDVKGKIVVVGEDMFVSHELIDPYGQVPLRLPIHSVVMTFPIHSVAIKSQCTLDDNVLFDIVLENNKYFALIKNIL